MQWQADHPRGLRITVDFVLKLIGDGYTAEEIVREYPELEKDDVYQAAKYAAVTVGGVQSSGGRAWVSPT